ncbi:thymidylate kinase-like isoform X2 [Ananas comosus]|uniref:Thymidylate kinase n=1 Tax=Ananas comosus TaxID=4615 RepID=A0A6P5GGZ9_ANACO|nr:thymidylate kinase-like isoform X2 [Ananas comosus]
MAVLSRLRILSWAPHRSSLICACKQIVYAMNAGSLGTSGHVKLSCRHIMRSFCAVEMDNDIRGCSRGSLIVLEGLDRSGKTSQCGNLLAYLQGKGFSVEAWQFPDRSTSVGKMISAYLANESQLDDRTIHLLFSANRALMENKLKSGTTLIVDRYSYSGVAFSAAKGLNIEWCKAPEVGLIAPDVVVYLDVPPEKAAERGGYGLEKYEQLDFQGKVAEHYHNLLDSSWEIVDGSQSIESVERQLKDLAMHSILTCQRGKPLTNLWSH